MKQEGKTYKKICKKGDIIMKKMDEISAKVIPAVSKFAGAKPIMALKDGFVLTMPITLIGSIFMLIKSFPIKNWSNIMAGIFGETMGCFH